MNLLGALSVISSVVGFAVAHRYFGFKPLSQRIVVFLVSGTLAIPSVLFAIYYFHILPERAWFYTLRSWPGTEFLAFFLGMAGGSIAAMLPRRLLVVPLFCTIATASVPYLKMVLNPLKVGELRDQWDGDACLQSTPSTCGPASIASMLRFAGHSASEREIAEAAHSSASGTEAWYLARYLQSRGFSPRFDFRSTFTPSVGLPALVGVRVGNFGHFIAVLEINGGDVTLVDPLSGKRKLKLADFMKEYAFTGFHMTVTKDSSGL